MIKVILLLGSLGLTVGCASLSPLTRQILDNPPPVAAAKQIDNVFYVDQNEGDCGPAALSSVFSWAGHPTELQTLQSEIYNQKQKGTLPVDLINASRRRGLLAIPVGNFNELLKELANGHPVIILQNLGLSWLPKWHYTVVNGYDLSAQKMTVLAKKKSQSILAMTHFERHWQLADYWGLVVLPPGRLSASADELAQMRAAAALEKIGLIHPAGVAYKSILDRWPTSLSAHIGLANVAYLKNDYATAVNYLKAARQYHPESEVIKNNLAFAEKAAKENRRHKKK